MSWLPSVLSALDERAPNETIVLVTVARVRGSAPREVGAQMIISSTSCTGTIGGGQLEALCQQEAKQYLDEPKSRRQGLVNFPLGPQCGQCCGGTVDVLFEPLSTSTTWLARLRKEDLSVYSGYRIVNLDTGESVTATDACASLPLLRDEQRTLLSSGALYKQHEKQQFLIQQIGPPTQVLGLFGAGHVGRAVAKQACELGWHVYWVDSRAAEFPSQHNCEQILTPDPAAFAKHLPKNSWALVMTHSHSLDFDICSQLLARNDLGYIGLIGSSAKRRRFIRMFKQAGLSADAIGRLTCPIGLAGITGKKPAEIAISVTAQLLALESSSQQNLQTKNDHKNKDQTSAALYC